MRFLKNSLLLLSGFIVMTSFSQCSSAKELQDKAPMEFGEVYCQAWTGGVEAAGSGIDIFIPVEEGSITELDSVYFRGKATKLERKEFNGSVTYIGRFRSKPAKDIVISSDPNEEYGNTIEIKEKIPFELDDSECVVSYTSGDKTRYYKVTNIVERPRNNYPSMRSN